MYRRVDLDTPGVVGCEISGTATTDDYESAKRDLREAIDEHGKIRLLVWVPETPDTEMDSADGPLDFVYEHEDDVERIAVIGEDTMVKWLARLGNRKLSPTLKRFDTDEEDDAKEWLAG